MQIRKNKMLGCPDIPTHSQSDSIPKSRHYHPTQLYPCARKKHIDIYEPQETNAKLTNNYLLIRIDLQLAFFTKTWNCDP